MDVGLAPAIVLAPAQGEILPQVHKRTLALARLQQSLTQAREHAGDCRQVAQCLQQREQLLVGIDRGKVVTLRELGLA